MILGLDPNFMSFGTSASHITMYDKMSLHQVASTQRTYYTHSVSFSMKSKLGLKQQDFFFFASTASNRTTKHDRRDPTQQLYNSCLKVVQNVMQIYLRF